MNERLVQLDIPGLYRQTAARRHRIPRVDHEVHQHLLELSGIGADGPQVGRKARDELYLLADEPAEHRVHPGDERVQVEPGGLQHLLSAEREQLPRQCCRALPRLDNLVHVRAAVILRPERVHHESRVPENGR